MNFNLPSQVRLALYILTAVGTIVVGYLFDSERIGQNEVVAWGSLVTLVNTMAAFNVTPDDSAK